MKKTISLIIWSLILIALIVGGYFYYQHSKLHPSTDDAYVQANTIQIAAQITGPVDKIFVQNNQKVKKGQLLFSINPKPFEYALNKAKADLQVTRQQVQAEEDTVATAKAELNQAKANYEVAQQNAPRTIELAKKGQVSKAQGVEAQGQLQTAKAAMVAAKAKLQQAIETLGKSGAQNAELLAAKASVEQAELNLAYTKVYSPGNGYLVNFLLRPGTMVTQNAPLFALIEDDKWWVDANYKETDLKRIKPGQKATVTLDIYPDHVYQGYVQSISSGSGAAFSLLPPENATGNWVKVTQRFPVKVIITSTNPAFPLRVGASAAVTINTRDE